MKRNNMKKALTAVLSVALLLAFCAGAWAAQPDEEQGRRRRGKTAYQKVNVPQAWRYEAGYTLWRVQRNMPASKHTYKLYRLDRDWRGNMHRYYRPQELLLDTADWTVTELAEFLNKNQELFKFHPAGIEE